MNPHHSGAPFIAGRPELLFGVNDVEPRATGTTGTMTSARWMIGADGEPSVGGLGLLVDDVFAYSIVAQRPRGHWALSTEIVLDVCGAIGVPPTTFRAESRVIQADRDGGLSRAEIHDDSEKMVIAGTQRLRFFEGEPPGLGISAQWPLPVVAGQTLQDVIGLQLDQKTELGQCSSTIRPSVGQPSWEPAWRRSAGCVRGGRASDTASWGPAVEDSIGACQLRARGPTRCGRRVRSVCAAPWPHSWRGICGVEVRRRQGVFGCDRYRRTHAIGHGSTSLKHVFANIGRADRSEAHMAQGRSTGSPPQGGGTARSVLFSMLSAVVYRDPEPVPTRALVQVLGMFGFEEKAARQAVNRASVSGWIESSRHGREALWTVATGGRRLLDEGSVRVADLSDRHRLWDGEVSLVSVSVPEADRTVRHQLKTRLAFAGFATASSGLWLSTRRSSDTAAAEIITELGLSNSNSFIARAGALGDLGALVRQAWDIDALGEKYRAFVDDFQSLEPDAGEATLLAFVRLVHERRRFVLLDPGLPSALLPSSWVGDEADEVWRKCYARWRRLAAASWQAIRDGLEI